MKRLAAFLGGAFGLLALIHTIRWITKRGENSYLAKRNGLMEMKELTDGLSLNSMHQDFEVASEDESVVLMGYRFPTDDHTGFEYRLDVLLENGQKAATYQGCQVQLCTPERHLAGVIELSPDSTYSLSGGCLISSPSVELSLSLGVVDHRVIFDITKMTE